MTAPEPGSSDGSRSVSLRSISVVTMLSMGQLVLLFALQLVLADVFGASDELDAYLGAYALPMVVGGILSGALGSVVVPLYNEQRALHGAAAADAALARIGAALTAVAAGCALLMTAGARHLVSWFYGEFDPAQAQIAVRILQLLSWLVPLNTLTGFLFGIYHARRQFFLPALVGLCGPILTLVLFTIFLDRSIDALAWAVLLGALAGVVLLLPGYPRRWSAVETRGGGAQRRFLYLLTPLLIGAAYSRLDVLVDRPLAAGLSAGSISQMGYASRIAAAVTTLATSGLSVVIFPGLARHAAAGHLQPLRDDLAEGWRLLSLLLIPVIAGLVFCGQPIITVLFRRGAFTDHDVQAVTGLLHLYAGFVLAAGIGELANRTLFALGKMWLSTWVCMFGFTVGAVTKFLVVDRFGAAGLVAATSLYYLLNAAMLLGLLQLVGVGRCYAGLPSTVARVSAASAIAIAMAFAIMSTATPARVLLGVLAAIVAYPLLLTAMGDEFARRTLAALRRRGAPADPANTTSAARSQRRI